MVFRECCCSLEFGSLWDVRAKAEGRLSTGSGCAGFDTSLLCSVEGRFVLCHISHA